MEAASATLRGASAAARSWRPAADAAQWRRRQRRFAGPRLPETDRDSRHDGRSRERQQGALFFAPAHDRAQFHRPLDLLGASIALEEMLLELFGRRFG